MITKVIIAITNICIAIGDTKFDNPKNGLLYIISVIIPSRIILYI